MKPLFKVGDRVTIREWDDMKKEFGLNSNGDIKVKFIFTSEMARLCGKTATVRSCEVTRNIACYALDFNEQFVVTAGVNFSDDMLTKAPPELSEVFRKKTERKFDEALI